MRLDRVEIKNFRSIRDMEIKLDPPCRVLVGINESGKTNILKALALLDPERIPAKDDIREFLPDEDPEEVAEVNFYFILDKDERLRAYEKLAPKVFAADLTKPIAKYDGKPMNLAQLFDIRTEIVYEVNLRTGKKRFVGLEFAERIKLIGKWVQQGATPIALGVGTKGPLTFDIMERSSIQEETAEKMRELVETSLTSFIIFAMAETIMDELPECIYWSYNEANLLPGQIAVDAFTADPNSCVPLKHMFALAGYTDVATTISTHQARSNGLRNLLKRVAEVSTKHMRSVWKEYHGISIQLIPNGENIDANIEDTHNVYDLSRRSDGFKRFITFLLMVSAKVRTNELENTLYLHDEPDASLHPSGARYLRDELIKISEKNIVVYSTHSIFMIDRNMIKRHLIVEKKEEVSTVAEVNANNIVDEEVIYNALGHSIFESLRQKNIVFEGWRDKQLFKVALSKVPSEHKDIKTPLSNVGACHARGVKDIGRITPMIELANRECLIVSDNDQIARERQREYDGYGTWLRYDEILEHCPAVTGEDFIKVNAFQPIINQLRAENSSLPELKHEDLAVDGGRLAVIQKWLFKGGITKEKVGSYIDKIKTDIFTNLKPSQIEPSYYDLLEQLVIKL